MWWEYLSTHQVFEKLLYLWTRASNNNLVLVSLFRQHFSMCLDKFFTSFSNLYHYFDFIFTLPQSWHNMTLYKCQRLNSWHFIVLIVSRIKERQSLTLSIKCYKQCLARSNKEVRTGREDGGAFISKFCAFFPLYFYFFSLKLLIKF